LETEIALWKAQVWHVSIGDQILLLGKGLDARPSGDAAGVDTRQAQPHADCRWKSDPAAIIR
jgi:hypothetical protein